MTLGRVSAVVATVLLVATAAGCGVRGRTEARSDGNQPARSDASSLTHARALGLTRRHPQRYRGVCAEQAEQAPAGSRTCPPLIPKGRLAVLYSGRLGGRDAKPGGFSADLASPSIGRVRNTRVETNGGPWRYDVAWTAGARESAVTPGIVRPPNASRRSSC